MTQNRFFNLIMGIDGRNFLKSAHLIIGLSLFIVQGCVSTTADSELLQSQKLSRFQNVHDQFMKSNDQSQIQKIWQKFSSELQAQLPLETLMEMRQSIGSLGAEAEVESEMVFPLVNYDEIYYRTSTYENDSKAYVLIIAFDVAGKIASFGIIQDEPPAPSNQLNYEVETELRLPFQGAWHVFWGGRTVLENYHAATANQRFAFDFLITRKNKSFRGNGKKLTDYFSFDNPILAPGDGIVVQAVDKYEDNPVGTMDSEHPPGNFVVIDHGSSEYSVLAHLKKGSLKVKVDQYVKVGQVIGRCGNSGNSSEPHLHYHLQDGPEFGVGDGLPVQFHAYLLGDREIEKGEPRRGMTIQNAPR